MVAWGADRLLSMAELITPGPDGALHVPDVPIIPFIEGDDGYVGYVEGAIGPRCDQFGHGQQPIGAPCHHPNRAGASPASGDECAGSAEARLRVWRGPGPSRSRGWHSTG